MLLPDLTSIETDDACMSFGGLVDRDTACAGDVTLWDATLWDAAELVASLERRGSADRPASRTAHGST